MWNGSHNYCKIHVLDTAYLFILKINFLKNNTEKYLTYDIYK